MAFLAGFGVPEADGPVSAAGRDGGPIGRQIETANHAGVTVISQGTAPCLEIPHFQRSALARNQCIAVPGEYQRAARRDRPRIGKANLAVGAVPDANSALALVAGHPLAIW